MLTLLALLPLAQAGDFMDVWVSTALEDTNILAGPDAYSPAMNFVERGNRAFFENYETRATDDISQGELVLYRADDGYFDGWSTEAALVLRTIPFLDPDQTDPGTLITDDGSFVRIVRNLGGEDHEISLTGFAINSGRFRLGYSYDLTWGGRNIYAFTTGSAPGVRLQWDRGGNYVFAGAKTAVGDYVDPVSRRKNNQAYYGGLFGAGLMVGDNLKLEAGSGIFQQGQILNVDDTLSEHYGALIMAYGGAAQVGWRSRSDMPFIESADLRLYRNGPEFARNTYIRHTQLDGSGVLMQGEINVLSHNLLSATNDDTLVMETGIAGDLQTLFVRGGTSLAIDLVYKDLAYILFNVPGLTSGVAMNPDMETTAQLYGRIKAAHYFANARTTPSIGLGLMQPATYTTSDGTFVQYTERDKEQVPSDQNPAAILSSVAGVQVDMSDSVVLIGEVLYTVDNNQSEFVQTEESPEGDRIAAPWEERNILGVNLIMRARF